LWEALAREGGGVEERVGRVLGELRRQLAAHYPEWRPEGLRVAGAGLSFLVCRAETETFGTVAIRVPWVASFVSANDDGIAARQLLQQEAGVAAHVAAHGIAAPRVHALHLGDEGFDFMVSEFVEADGSPPDARAFGRLMRAVHECPPPDVPLVEQTDRPFGLTIAGRIARRAAAFGALTGRALDLPPVGAMAALLGAGEGRRSLLHMDARPENLFTRAGRIVAIADWANALVGDPALELARMAEWGHLGDEFLAGYGEARPFAALPPAVESLYRLDAVLVLALVFLDEAPDAELARPLVERALELAASLQVAG
jgi:aminoglycoside phosphotransferase (APT) family kinase protein